MEAMWDDGKCNPQCNNVACDFNDCSSGQVAGQCVADQEKEGLDTASPPAEAAVRLHLDLAKPRLAINKDINQSV